MYNKQLILASASPRRKEFLAFLNVPFVTQHADIDESTLLGESPEIYASRLAHTKAEVVYNALQNKQDHYVLGSDTCVVIDDHILGKPEDYEDAKRMLSLLSGQWHKVLTAVGLIGSSLQTSILVESLVKFRQVCTSEIQWYWQSGEPKDKAGAYGIQGLGSIFVERVEGSYSSIVGLPLCETRELLLNAGFDMQAGFAVEASLNE